MSIPAGAAHSSVFAADGCQVVILRPLGDDGQRLFPIAPRRLRDRRGGSLVAPRLARSQRSSSAPTRAPVSRSKGWRSSCSRAPGGSIRRASAAIRDGCRPFATICTTRYLARCRSTSSARPWAAIPAHVARAFRHAYGTSVTAYARTLRLEWATVAVATTDDPIMRIALEAGFADQSHFTRSFRRHHGITPGRYRELVRA